MCKKDPKYKIKLLMIMFWLNIKSKYKEINKEIKEN